MYTSAAQKMILFIFIPPGARTCILTLPLLIEKHGTYLLYA
jgi:hypothetical protein